MELKLNIPFQCPENIAPYLQKVFDGEYDVGVHLPVGARIVDLGGNYGSFALWATHRWPGAEVMSYEPHPEVFKVLKRNTQAYSQIMCCNWGVGNPGMRILNDGANNDGERSFHDILNNPNPTGVHCEVKDPLTLPECDLLKMDIEGCEMEVLVPLIKAGRTPSLILLEHHNHSLRRAIDNLLSDYVQIGGEVYSMLGLGVAKYLRKDLFNDIMGVIIR
jgi:FkbM family methyltransferase